MDRARIEAVVQAVLREISGSVAVAGASSPPREAQDGLHIDLPDPTALENRRRPGIKHPSDEDGLRALMASTSARIGVGRAGPRYRTGSLLLFQADHAITQDALMRDVDPGLLEELGLFAVQTQVSDREAYLLRPDLGRLLSPEARATLAERCTKAPQVQLVVGDGLSAAAIEANLREILPVIVQGLRSAGLSIGTPFFVRFARVGLMNDINTVLDAQVVVLLIGERPGLGRAESMSAYLGFQPRPESTDADRNVICNIFDGGTNPLEAGAAVVQLVQEILTRKASGVKMKLAAA
jgi:ethanolamine ammonia-lyase small subunit